MLVEPENGMGTMGQVGMVFFQFILFPVTLFAQPVFPLPDNRHQFYYTEVCYLYFTNQKNLQIMLKKIYAMALFLFIGSALWAQEVTVYTECNYSGQRISLVAGSYSGYLMRIPNDRLSCLQIPNGMKVTIYEHENYQGRSRTYTASIPCLENDWRNMASSFIIEADNTQPVYNQNDYVTVYADCYQRGNYQVLRPGRYTGSQLGILKNSISSFAINGTNLRVKLYLNNEYASGYSTDFENSVYCLPASQNDKTGSLVIEYKQGVGGNTGNTGNNTNERYATFYSACDYEGNALRLMPGTYNGAKLGVLKNNIESVQVPAGMRVRAYTGSDNLFGQSVYINQDMSCLDYNLKDKIASLVVEDQGGGYNTGSNDPVVIYMDDNYRGQSATLLAGNYSTMAAAGGFSDNAISSLKVPDGYRVVLYEFENFTGKSLTVTSSRPNFFLTSWNDKTSSLIVYKDR
jgi:hypothetical protein